MHLQDQLIRPVCEPCHKAMRLTHVERWHDSAGQHVRYFWQCHFCHAMKYERAA
jgi:hypothetical protein